MSVDPQRAKQIFLDAVENRPAGEWDEYARQACGGDAPMLQWVRELLAAHCESDPLLDRAAGDATLTLASSAATPATQPVDAQIGPYRLLQQLGEGGMGIVYLAEQLEPVRRKVALKIIRPGMGSSQAIARFEAERQALSLMEHPNIARVFDAGTTPSGQPYFVMELVRGQPITAYCDEHHLTTRERLELLLPVCQAIQHAHQKGVIHRDIKPSNVLVAEFDQQVVPKVIDFGVAKAISQPLTENTVFTAFGQIVGTLEYMSPEQAQVNQLDIDTRSDIYSLGVLLYELLTGSTPLDRHRLRSAAWDEMLRMIREEEPPKPSTRLESSEQLPNIAARRRTAPRQLSGAIAGDLDWIVMKALEKERNRRYDTATGLARDIQRYLADEPVEACPPSLAYRLRKFVRRHQGPVVAVMLVAALLIFGIIGTTLGLIRVERLRRLAVDAQRREGERAIDERKARLAAETEQAKAEAAALRERKANENLRANYETLANIFSEFDVDDFRLQGQPLEAVLAQRLIHASQQLETQKLGTPLECALMQVQLAQALVSLGFYAEAVQLLEPNCQIIDEQLDHAHPKYILAYHSLAVACLHAGQVPRALAILEPLAAQLRGAPDATREQTILTLEALGGAYISAGKYQQARDLFEEVVNAWQDVPNSQQRMLTAKSNLAAAYDYLGKPQQARPIYEEVLETRRQALGFDHPLTLTSIANFAPVLLKLGETARAQTLYEEAYAGRRSRLGTDHPHTLHSMGQLANCYANGGALDKALPLLAEVYHLKKAKLGPKHPDTVLSLATLAYNLRRAHKFGEAVPMFREVLQIREATLGPEHPKTITAMNNLAMALFSVDQRQEGFQLLERSFALQRQIRGDAHPETLATLVNLVDAYAAAERLADGAAIVRDVFRAVQAVPHPEALAYANQLADLGWLLVRTRAYADAEAGLRQSLAIRRDKQPGEWSTFCTQATLGAALAGQMQYDEAEPLLREGLRGLYERRGAIPIALQGRIGEILEHLVALYAAADRPHDSAQWQQRLDDFRAGRTITFSSPP